jgi:Zn-finger nucleic acid-binding protein
MSNPRRAPAALSRLGGAQYIIQTRGRPDLRRRTHKGAGGQVPIDTLKCPMCGAPAAADATRCGHCGTPLATVACPSCFGTIFIGSKFCSHCGARAEKTDDPDAAPLPCPRCRTAMSAVTVGGTRLSECRRCGGLWADQSAFDQIRVEEERQSAVLGMATAAPLAGAPTATETVRYLPCPCCGKLMNRVNFARCSGVVIDVCKAHGTWFDRDELRRIVEFIRGGGLDLARSREMADLEAQRRELEAEQAAAAAARDGAASGDRWRLGGSLGTSLTDLLDFLRR